MDRYALRIAFFCAVAFSYLVFIVTLVDSRVHHIVYGERYYWMGYWVVLGSVFPFILAYISNKNYENIFIHNINKSAKQKSILTFFSLFGPILLVQLLNFRPEIPHLALISNSLSYGLIIATIVYVHYYKFEYLDSQINNNDKIERTKLEHLTWLFVSMGFSIIFILLYVMIYLAFTNLSKQYTSIQSEQILLFNSFVLDLFVGGFFAIFAFIEFYKKVQYLSQRISDLEMKREKDRQYSVITKSGYVVPLMKGEKGLAKKLDEVLGDSDE